MSFPNVNETTVLLSATTTPQTVTLPFWPQHVYVTNSGTVPVYFRGNSVASPIGITAPVAGTPYSFSEILPGRDAMFNWSSTTNAKNLEYVTATGTANVCFKLTRATSNPT